MSDQDTKPAGKSVSKSVAMPETIWAAIDAHAPATPWKDRSGYMRHLAERDLNAAGMLGGDAEFIAKIAAAVKEDSAVKRKIERVLRTSMRVTRSEAA